MYRQYQTAIPVLLNQVRYDYMYRLCLQHDCGKAKRGAQIAPKLYCSLGQYSSRLIILQLGGLAAANRLLPPQPVVVYNNNLFINILHLSRRSPRSLGDIRYESVLSLNIRFTQHLPLPCTHFRPTLYRGFRTNYTMVKPTQGIFGSQFQSTVGVSCPTFSPTAVLGILVQLQYVLCTVLRVQLYRTRNPTTAVRYDTVQYCAHHAVLVRVLRAPCIMVAVQLITP